MVAYNFRFSPCDSALGVFNNAQSSLNYLINFNTLECGQYVYKMCHLY